MSRIIETLEASKAYVHIPRSDRDYAIEVGLRMLRLRHIVSENDGIYAANPADLHILRYYSNAIAHLLPGRANAAETSGIVEAPSSSGARAMRAIPAE